MRILGVDPGLTRCGLGAVEVRERRVRLVDVGVARTTPEMPLEERLLAIADELTAWIARLEPEAVAIERVYVGNNVSTVSATTQVAGLAMVAAARAGCAVALHTPTEVKATVSGYGGAGKAQVQEMVRRILELEEPPRPADAADALALAITHAWRGRAAALDRGGHTAPAVAAASTMTPAQHRWARARAAAERASRRAPNT
ncbi:MULTISPECIES: crossover junction endodeoxyribonuclease RuvC [unclassified Pseudactinotalea]|uniref:crossover junction endodeoxyribonuclease RuvC n=1 Tax=unclassified Pseudactinotalea TaxID=2649176 RepID=UPI00128DDDA3|nr:MULTISPECIES: crossover junction endodeoxyribonuclease RuvC [unclassified Pseudactinotalea]MPV49369.1 crossover junction endodeoxyribonuclease RuvC [Pseudactinotalea sp. HY160]QGH69338.1 crossover junction endodeoxyribonuclease RuvC [Pseudactinotalea sp. HY158]